MIDGCARRDGNSQLLSKSPLIRSSHGITAGQLVLRVSHGNIIGDPPVDGRHQEVGANVGYLNLLMLHAENEVSHCNRSGMLVPC